MGVKTKILVLSAMGVLAGVTTLVAQRNTPTLNELVDAPIRAAIPQSDGSMVLAGQFSNGHIIRIGSDGTVDESFAASVRSGLFNRPVTSLVVNDDDSIIAGGHFTNFDQQIVGYIIKLDAEGSPDIDFAAKTGTGFDDVVHSVSLQSDRKILVAGLFRQFNGHTVGRVARLNTDGSLDTDFAVEDGFDGPVSSIKEMKNGDIVVGGQFNHYKGRTVRNMARLSSSGQLKP